jgi:hypothetical protein
MESNNNSYNDNADPPSPCLTPSEMAEAALIDAERDRQNAERARKRDTEDSISMPLKNTPTTTTNPQPGSDDQGGNAEEEKLEMIWERFLDAGGGGRGKNEKRMMNSLLSNDGDDALGKKQKSRSSVTEEVIDDTMNVIAKGVLHDLVHGGLEAFTALETATRDVSSLEHLLDSRDRELQRMQASESQYRVSISVRTSDSSK